MSGFNWDDHPIVAPQAKGSSPQSAKAFSWDDHPIVAAGAPSTGQSAVDKLASGMSLGLADEASGGMEAVGRVVGVKGLGGRIKDIGLAEDGPTLDPSTLKDAYLSARDKDRAVLNAEQEAHPYVSNTAEFAGSLLNPVGKFMPGAGAVKTGAAMGAVQGFGSSTADNAVGVLKDTATGAALGAGAGKLAEKVAPYVGKGLAKAGLKAKDVAESAAVNATGATGKEATKFADNAGRELLDRKIVRFGDNQAKIAERAGAAVDAANSQIDSALTKLEENGVKVDGDAIKSRVLDRIKSMKSDPSQADVAKLLQNEVENISAAQEAKGATDFGVKEAEGIKRGYNRKAGNWADPEKGMVGKEMYQGFRGAVEDAAQAADPETAKLFEEGKKSFGLLRPIEEAAERRVSTTSQSPVGGLADLTAAGAGALKAGPVGAIVAPIARRALAPRAASSLAVTADKISDGLMKVSGMAELKAANPAAFQSLVQKVEEHYSSHVPLPRAADSGQDVASEKKGPDKWANDGKEKLLKHDSEIDPQILEKLKSDPKSKQLLIAASDLKPGSKAMDQIMNQIKNRAAKEKN